MNPPRVKTAAEAAPAPVPESVRDRILATARELFYREGARAVGVDTVVAQSGVAKTSLYRWFPSKDALIAAVLEEEARDRWTGWELTAQRADPEPRARLRAHMAGLLKYVNNRNYSGCPFMNVIVAFPDQQHPARKVAIEVCVELKRRIRGLVDAIEGVRDREELTDQLMLLVEGTLTAAHVLGSNGPQNQLISAADAIIDSHLRATSPGDNA
jgi:AcrR family transcriptional regulator